MGNGVSSFIFTCRGADKTVGGEVARATATTAQLVNTAQAYAKTGFAGAKVAEGFVNNIDNLAKEATVWGKGAKALQWAQRNVNPLIGVCAGIKILTAEDKEKAICTEIPGFGGMLLAESQFKKLQNTKTAQNFLQKVASIGGKGGTKGKVLAAIVEGVGFAAASIGGYVGTAKLGECVIEGERAIRARKKFEQIS